MTAVPAPSHARRLERRVAALITVQLAVTVALSALALHRGDALGAPWAVGTLALAFALTGFFAMSLELHSNRFTFTLAEAVLAVGFFAVGPLGLAIAAALGEGIDMAVQRHAPLKMAFNVSNRLAATTAAGMAFAAFGRSDVHDVAAWLCALAAALCFSLLDVASTAAVLSIVEKTRFHNVFVRSVSTGLLATLMAAPVGLVAIDLVQRGPLVPLLLAPIAGAVALNARYGIAQRDEHLRFERLYESSARTASLVAFDHAVGSLAGEARALGTGVAALCCVWGADGEWCGAYADDTGVRRAESEAVAAAVSVAARAGNAEIDVADAPELQHLTSDARSVLAVAVQHDRAGRVVFVVLREGATNGGARNRIETLEAFAHNAALIVSNALLHEERAIALARQLDLNRQKSDFVAAVSHELRTPLAVMLGSVHTLERLDGRMTDEQRTQLFDMTVEQGSRLQRLIDELLLVAAAEHAEVQLDLETIDLGELFAAVAAATAAMTSGRLVWATNGAGTVVCDASKLERILGNLVENAAKYAPAGTIELQATRDGAEIRLAVSDHGPGIPEHERERVFDRFVQLDQSSTRRQGGTGLGLHLCRQLATAVEGRIELSETPGGGCTFVVAVPDRCTAADAGADASVPEPEHEPTAARDAGFGNLRTRPASLGPRRREVVR